MTQDFETTEGSLTEDQSEADPVGRSLWSDAFTRLRRDKSAMICLAVIVLYALIALFGLAYELAAERIDRLPTFSETADYENTHLSPAEAWSRASKAEGWWQRMLSRALSVLGTDWGGKSVLLKTLLSVRASMTVGLMANIIAVPLGMVLGAIAGYYGGRIDDLIVWFYTTLASIPGIILLIALKYAFKGKVVLGLDLSGIHGLYIALAVVSWIGTCRLVRAEVMKIRQLEYVLAARAIGTPDIVIMFRHVLRNVSHIAIINFSLGFVGAIKAEVILSYLGLGVPVGTPSWGSMINAARMDLFTGRWWELTSAVAAMFFLVLALNIFGDRLRDALDPRLRNI